jgi:hypothetical protein
MIRASQGISPLLQWSFSAALLLLIFLTAPFPHVQIVLHAMLVLGISQRADSPVLTALFAALAGWALEGSLRMYPHLGGTAWANLSIALAGVFLARRWPAEGLGVWMARLGGLHVFQILLTHVMVQIACGPHLWGRTWITSLLTLPLWGWISWKLLRLDARIAGR